LSCSNAEFSGQGRKSEGTVEEPADVAGGFGLACVASDKPSSVGDYLIGCGFTKTDGSKLSPSDRYDFEVKVKQDQTELAIRKEPDGEKYTFEFNAGKASVAQISIEANAVDKGKAVIKSIVFELAKALTLPPLSSESFISKWNTAASGAPLGSRSITLPLESEGDYDFTVDWGDGSTSKISTWDDPAKVHDYLAPGEYTVTISGKMYGFNFKGYSRNEVVKIIEIMQFGKLRLGNGTSYFSGAYNLKITASDALDLTGTTNLYFAFQGCHSLDAVPSMAKWNTGDVINMGGLFQDTSNFNQDINSWNVSKVTSMAQMFSRSRKFDQPLNQWNVAKVGDMQSMFADANSFNQSLESWSVGVATSMDHMFDRTTSLRSLPSWYKDGP
jgi:surface protein